MSINIGGLAFFNIRGVPEEEGQTAEIITRKGFNGSAMRQMGIRGSAFTLIAEIDVDTAVAGRLAIIANKTLQGDVVSFEMPDETQFTLFMVEFVRHNAMKRVQGFSGGTLATGVPDYKLTAEISGRFP